MSKNLVILLANGLEEVEFSLPYDLCYRAGIQITLVAVHTASCDSADPLLITGSQQLQLRAHITLPDFLQEYRDQKLAVDAVFLPGGMPGSKHLAENTQLINFLCEYKQSLEADSRYLAAICAAPAYVLGNASGLLRGLKYTCYPGAEAVVPAELNATRQDSPLVEDGRIITASGMGSAHLLAERLITRLVGEEEAARVMQAMLYR